VFLKQEFVQPSGSYKLRGLSHLIETRLASFSKEYQNKPVRVVAASGGNAGNAVSIAAEFHSVRSTIVVPKSTSEMMKNKIASNGAELIVAGDNIGAADEYLRTVLIPSICDEYVIYCHPYDIPEIWEGHSTMIDEIVEELQNTSQLQRLKAVVCSIGGGGLYNGIVKGLKRHNLSTPVLTLETDSCPTFQKAIDAGKPVTLKSFQSIAVSLACPYVSQQSMDNYSSHKTMNFLVSDAQAANACIKFCDDYNVIVEPACGVALCSVYEGTLEQLKEELSLTKDDIVVVVVCGGSATSFLDLMNYKETYRQ
jgi:L-serine/L-threonine ammonia-lyase